jgi:histone acetyltransferase 1
VSYTEKQAKADDVDSMLTEAFGGELLMGEEGKAEFEAQLVASAGKVEVGAYGEEIARQALPRGGDDNAHLVLTRFNLASAPEWLRAVHRRMEPLLLFFIDGASGIDQNDSAWDVIMALRQSGPSLQVVSTPPPPHASLHIYSFLYTFMHIYLDCVFICLDKLFSERQYFSF